MTSIDPFSFGLGSLLMAGVVGYMNGVDKYQAAPQVLGALLFMNVVVIAGSIYGAGGAFTTSAILTAVGLAINRWTRFDL